VFAPMKRLRYAIAVAAGAVAASAAFYLGACDHCEPPVTFSQINNQIFQRSCAITTVCHTATGAWNAGHLDLETNPYTALLFDPVDNAQAKAEGKKRVKPGDPFNSFLMIKLTLPLDSTDDGGYQESMPLTTNAHLPDCDLAGLRAWILAGAPKN
jgi:hypothetical protein